jgi:hypothetical protein
MTPLFGRVFALPCRPLRFRPGVESLEGRAVPAHLEVFAPGGVAANATGSRGSNDAHAIGLGDSNVTRNLLASTDLAGAAFDYVSAPDQKMLILSGSAADEGSLAFGTTKFDQVGDLGNLTDFNIVADPGEVNGQPIDVTLSYTASFQSATALNPGTGHFEVKYANEQDGPFVNTLGTGDLPGSVNPGATVVLHSAIGKGFSVGVKANVAGLGANGPVTETDLAITLTMTLGTPGAPPSSGISTGNTEVITPGTPTGNTGVPITSPVHHHRPHKPARHKPHHKPVRHPHGSPFAGVLTPGPGPTSIPPVIPMPA